MGLIVTRWLFTVHSCHCLVLSLAQTPSEPGLLFLSRPSLKLFAWRSYVRISAPFGLEPDVFNGVTGLSVPGLSYYSTYFYLFMFFFFFVISPKWEKGVAL